MPPMCHWLYCFELLSFFFKFVCYDLALQLEICFKWFWLLLDIFLTGLRRTFWGHQVWTRTVSRVAILKVRKIDMLHWLYRSACIGYIMMNFLCTTSRYYLYWFIWYVYPRRYTSILLKLTWIIYVQNKWLILGSLVCMIWFGFSKANQIHTCGL